MAGPPQDLFRKGLVRHRVLPLDHQILQSRIGTHCGAAFPMKECPAAPLIRIGSVGPSAGQNILVDTSDCQVFRARRCLSGHGECVSALRLRPRL